MAMRHGLSLVQVPAVGRGGHVLAGAAIMACGVLMKLGLLSGAQHGHLDGPRVAAFRIGEMG